MGVLSPEKLKEEGNALYAAAKYGEAVEAWKRALTMALKQSMREPTTLELIELQTKLRLNIAQGLIMYEDYVLAKEHLLIILDRDPQHGKALYRLALVYQGLMDFEKALGIAKRGITLHPEDPAFRILHNKLIEEERELRKKNKGKAPVLSLDQYCDERATTVSVPPAGYLKFDDSVVEDADALEALVKQLIAWKCNLDTPEQPSRADQLKHVDDDLDDWRESKRWLTPYTHERLRDDRTVLAHALPFSALHGLEYLLRGDAAEQCTEIVSELGTAERSRLPDLSDLLPADAHPRMTAEGKMRLLRNLNSEGNNLRSFTVHCLNARGDDEMEVRWSSFLERVPGLQQLHLIMIGFNRPDDPYAASISAKDYLSPQLAKHVANEQRKVACRLYKGTYNEFLDSDNVAKATGRSVGTILGDSSHPFHPDMVIIPQCNLSRRYTEFVPVICKLLLANVPILFLGQSACELPTHEALQLPAVLGKLRARFLTPVYWNPFMVCVKPAPDYPEMSVVTKDGAIIDNYRGLSAKYAVGVWVQGLQYGAGETTALVSEIAAGSLTDLERLREELKAEGCDVDREETALTQLMASAEYKQKLTEAVAEHEAKVEDKTAELFNKLHEKLAATKAAATTPVSL